MKSTPEPQEAPLVIPSKPSPAPAPAERWSATDTPGIERDEQMDRDYIPLPGGWELQTKGKGSTLRLLDKKAGERHPLPLPEFVIEFIERMAREVNAATNVQPKAADGDGPTWAGAAAFIQHAQNAAGSAGADGHWSDDFLAWYKPAEWLGEHRAAAVFLGSKIAALANAQPKQIPTPEDINAQNWAGMDGAIAYHLIDRHGENWNHVGRLMEAWRAANPPEAQAPALAPEPLRKIVTITSRSPGMTERELGLSMGRIQEICEAALADQCVAVAHGWRPIGTAPKDGSMFLCWVAAERWSSEDGGGSGRAHDVSQVDFCWWRDGVDGNGYFDPACGQIGDCQDVTHWMPLPSAPSFDVPVREDKP